MASSATATVVRRLATKLAKSPTASVSGTTNMVLKLWANNGAGTRQFHASGPKHYGDDYLHAEHMYNVQGMKNRKLKVFLGSFGSLAVGIMVPVWAVQYQMKKQGGL